MKLRHQFKSHAMYVNCSMNGILMLLAMYVSRYNGSVALLLHFHKVLALLKCKIEVNPVARIPQATSTAQFQFARCWWCRESVLRG